MIPFFKKGGKIVEGQVRAKRITSSETFPSEVDVVIIGGGYVGSCTALELVERGLSVALCEKGYVAGEASGRSLGWIESQFLDPVKMELIARSKTLWASMNERVGADTGYRQQGVISLLAGD
jgi:glycine/D-amino acid oxidase-like deaminating enzyme